MTWKRRILRIKWIRWHGLWIYQSLFSAILFLPSELMNNVAMVIHGLSNRNFCSQRPLFNVQSTSKRDQHWVPDMALFPRVISRVMPVIWWHFDFIGLLPPRKRQCLVLTGIDSYSGYGFTFTVHSTSAKTMIYALTQCLFYHQVIPHCISSDKGTCIHERLAFMNPTGL